jgi:hypothetical protein
MVTSAAEELTTFIFYPVADISVSIKLSQYYGM